MKLVHFDFDIWNPLEHIEYAKNIYIKWNPFVFKLRLRFIFFKLDISFGE